MQNADGNQTGTSQVGFQKTQKTESFEFAQWFSNFSRIF